MTYCAKRTMGLKDLQYALLEVKDADIRLLTLEQAYSATDKSIHIGGCCSSTIPLVSLFYGGFIDLDIEQPTSIKQDKFVLSKGHSVALLASIYADIGYISESDIPGSRSSQSVIKGHPGPVLPGIDISTGPLGQGLSCAAGYALLGRRSMKRNVFCLAGDGELQEGMMWEAVMYAADRRLDNLCLIVDANNGQTDSVEHLMISSKFGAMFAASGWRCMEVDATQYPAVMDALDVFVNGPKDGRPTVIFCNTYKGFGACAKKFTSHKIALNDSLYMEEKYQQSLLRDAAEQEFLDIYGELSVADQETAKRLCDSMGYELRDGLKIHERVARVQKAPVREKKLQYDESALPVLNINEKYTCAKVLEQTMAVLAHDPRVMSVDADLSSISGLQPGVAAVDQSRALNVGVAEANMLALAEPFAASGWNCFVSTFCTFFEPRVVRRVAISYEERKETIEKGGWLSEGHNLDITMIGTASNFDTAANGATHMSNDDILMMDEMAHIKIIDVSCPQQLIGVAKWIAEGNRGLVYVRIMRAASGVIYGPEFEFAYGKAYTAVAAKAPKAVIVSSGRGVHEAIVAAKRLKEREIDISVVDMASFDQEMFESLLQSDIPVLVAEQNNGYLRKKLILSTAWDPKAKVAFRNTLNEAGEKQFIHSGTYKQLAERYGLSGEQLADAVQQLIEGNK